jgi:sugar O-acyltransferase (sialic acid O-acetyltransferase NeuD family)
MRRLAIVGAGGFARELQWILSEIAADARKRFEPFEVACLLENNIQRLMTPERGVHEEAAWLESNQVDALAIGIGDPSARLEIAERLKKQYPKIEWPPIIHPSVILDFNSCVLEEGVILCPGIIGTVNIVFESFSMVNFACTIGHEAKIGKGSVINPSVNVSGWARVGAGVLVGTGAQILEDIVIGDSAIVGAGAVVNKNVDPGTTVVGIPAKPIVRNR